MVPMPHLALVLQLPDWHALAGIGCAPPAPRFVLEPHLRFAGQPGEQWTMFFRDPSGNPIEIKGFADLDRVYEH
jgi:extradiol dioxygenase family protein